jgi:hypothetical protein
MSLYSAGSKYIARDTAINKTCGIKKRFAMLGHFRRSGPSLFLRRADSPAGERVV